MGMQKRLSETVLPVVFYLPVVAQNANMFIILDSRPKTS